MAKPSSPTGLNTTSASVLGLLALEDWPRPWTSYELAKQSQRSLSWFWPRAQRRLLIVPKDLVKLGYADTQAHARGKRSAPRYTITDSGRAALRDWLGEQGPSITIEAEELVRVFFADQGDIGQLRTTLHRIANHATNDRARLARVAADMDESAIGSRAGINALSIRLVSDIHTTIENWATWAIEGTADWQDPQESWDGARQVFRDVISAHDPQ